MDGWTLRLVIPNHEDGGAFPADIVVDEDDEGRDDMECETRRYVPERETCHMELLPDEPTTSIQPMRCTSCGHKTYAQLANFCPHCGARVTEVER